MLLKNRTQEQYIGVELAEWVVQVWPGQSVEVSDLTGKWLLSNYWHIFMKIETDGDKVEVAVKEKEHLRNQLSVAQDTYNVSILANVELKKDNAVLSEKIDEQKLKLSEANVTIKELETYIAELEAKFGVVQAEEGIEEETELSEEEKELIDLRSTYEKLTGKSPANNKKNDVDWLKAKILEAEQTPEEVETEEVQEEIVE